MSDTEVEERPVHLVVDCTPVVPRFDEDGTEIPVDAAPRVTEMPISDEEWEAMRQRERDAIADEQERIADEEALRAAVAGHADPVVQALAKRLGLA